jgi:hypothetical protein
MTTTKLLLASKKTNSWGYYVHIQNVWFCPVTFTRFYASFSSFSVGHYLRISCLMELNNWNVIFQEALMEITDDGFEEPQYQQLWQPERQDPYLSLFIRGALKVTTNLTLLWSLSRLLFRILSRLLWIWSLLAMATGLFLSLCLSINFSSKFSDSDASLDNVVSVRCMPWRSTCHRHHGPRGMWRLDIVS